MPLPLVSRAWRGVAPNQDGLISTANYIWNTNTLAWEAASGVAGAGSVTVTNFPATQAVSGPLTDAQLRADPIETLGALYATRIDEASASVTYVGKAEVGGSPASLVWQIQRITISGDLTTIEWADGDSLFNNRWNDRASLTYS